MKISKCYAFVLMAVLIISSCAPTIPKPNELIAPVPLDDNSGQYMCPYTSDGVVAPWVSKGIYAKAGAAVGRYAGNKAGQELLNMIPIFGETIAEEMGEALGRKIAIECAGGLEYIKETSDLSFNEINEMIVYLYVNYFSNEHWPKVWDLTSAIYPELSTKWQQALLSANRKTY